MKFMALLKIVNFPAPVLLTVGKPVEVFDANVEKLVSEMFETMYNAGGVGLAAPQIGESLRLICDGLFGRRRRTAPIRNDKSLKF